VLEHRSASRCGCLPALFLSFVSAHDRLSSCILLGRSFRTALSASHSPLLLTRDGLTKDPGRPNQGRLWPRGHLEGMPTLARVHAGVQLHRHALLESRLCDDSCRPSIARGVSWSRARAWFGSTMQSQLLVECWGAALREPAGSLRPPLSAVVCKGPRMDPKCPNRLI